MFAEMMEKVSPHIDFIIEMVNEKKEKKQVPENLKEGFDNSFEQLIKPACARFGNFNYESGFVVKVENEEEKEEEEDW